MTIYQGGIIWLAREVLPRVAVAGKEQRGKKQGREGLEEEAMVEERKVSWIARGLSPRTMEGSAKVASGGRVPSRVQKLQGEREKAMERLVLPASREVPSTA